MTTRSRSWILTFTILASLHSICLCKSDCTLYKVEQCSMSPFRRIVDNVDASQFCSEGEAMAGCIRNLTSDCNLTKYQELFVEGFRNAYRYLCLHKDEALERNLTCIMDEEVTHLTHMCINSLNTSLTSLWRREETSVLEIYNTVTEMCGTFPDFLLCNTKAVSHHCGVGASMMTIGFVTKLYEPIWKSFSCSGVLWVSRWWWLILLIAAVCQTLFFSICFCATYRKECHHNPDPFPVYRTGKKIARYNESETSNMYTPLAPLAKETEDSKTASSSA